VTSRHERRAALKTLKRFRKRVLAHQCVVDRAAVNAGVSIELGEAEHHRVHVAMGEPWCKACEACRRMQSAGRVPTLFQSHEVTALIQHWARKVREAKHRAECDAAERSVRGELVTMLAHPRDGLAQDDAPR
jgi:hypothetical protein